MPRFRAPAKDEALILQERGLDPSRVLIDLDSGNLYDRDRTPAPGVGESLMSGLRSAASGFVSPLTSLTSAAGAGIESLTGYRGVSDAADSMENAIQHSMGADPRVTQWVNVPGQTIGQLGSMMTGVGAASKLLSLGKAGSAVLGPVLGAGMTGGDTVSEELDRQAREGEERSPGKALLKGGVVGAASYPLEKFGLGRIFNEGEALAAKPFLQRMLSLGGKGALGESVEEGLQYGTVEGGGMTAEGLAERMKAGAIGGGVGGMLVAAPQLQKAAEAEGEGKKKASGKDMAAGKKLGYQGPGDITLDAMEASIRKGHEYKPVGVTTPVDGVFEQLRKAQVPMLRDDIKALFDIWGGSPANVPKVQQAAREMHDSWIASKPAKLQKAPDVIKKERDDVAALEKEIGDVRTRYEKLQKETEKEGEKAKAAPAGTRWEILNNENAALRSAEMLQLENAMEQLVTQKKFMLEQQADTSGAARRPVAEGDTMRTPMGLVEAQAADLQRIQALPAVEGGTMPGAPTGLEGAPIEVDPAPPAGGPLPGRLTSLEGAPIETGDFTSPTPVDINAPRPPIEAIQAEAAKSVENAKRNLERLTALQGKLRQDQRLQSPVQAIRQPVEDELKMIDEELAASTTEYLQRRKELAPKRTEVDAFMRGETLPGMEGENGGPFAFSSVDSDSSVMPAGRTGNDTQTVTVNPVRDQARWSLRDDINGEIATRLAPLGDQYSYEFEDLPNKPEVLGVNVKAKNGSLAGQLHFTLDGDQIALVGYDFAPEHSAVLSDVFTGEEGGIERIHRSETGLLKSAAKLKTHPAFEVAIEYEKAAGRSAAASGVKPTDFMRKAYKRVAESRKDYKRTKVDIPTSATRKGAAIAGYFDREKNQIHSREDDRETALHESIHSTNHQMDRAIRDQLRAQLKEDPKRTLALGTVLGRLLGNISPLYQRHEMDAILAKQVHEEGRRFSAEGYLQSIVDEALAQNVAAEAMGVPTAIQVRLGYALEDLGFPVGEFAHALRTEAGRPRFDESTKTYYSGVPFAVLAKNLELLGGKLGEYFKNNPRNGPLALLYDRTRSIRSRLAGAGPLGSYVAAKMDPIWTRLTQIENRKLTEAAPFADMLKNENVINWVFDSIDNQTENYDDLPEAYREKGKELLDFSKSFILDMQERGQMVRTGNTAPRLPEVIAGYFPTSVDQKVWEEAGTPEGYQKWEKVWVDNWRKYRPQDSEEQARALFRDFSSPISSVHAVGGEPLFMAARRAHGVPLPREMRDRDLMRGLQQYIGNFSADAVWTEFMQKDPLMRRAFGIKTDHEFVDHSAEDMDVEPDEGQWNEIIREGERVNAPWLESMEPGMPLGMPLLVRSEHGVAEAFLASLTETPTHRMTAAMKQFNSVGQIASSMLMQLGTGIRDTFMGVSELAAYVPSTSLIRQFADVVTDYSKYRDEARESGALKNDVYRHQAANIVSKAAYETSRTLRSVTARNFLDEFPRVFINHAVRETVLQDLRTAGRSPLAEEFGAMDADPETTATSTAAAIVNRIAPNYDARSLPKDWIPQTRSLIGYLTQLSTWGVARYNTWYEDHYLPATKSKNPNRLIRSLLFGTIGGAAANALIDELFKKKPAKLTWQEWLGLSTDQQIKEAAPLFFGIAQTQGLFGVAGDMALPLAQFGNRLATGAGPSINVPDLGDATVPALMIGQDFLMTTADFIAYAASKKWNVDFTDFADLANEYAKSMQTWRDIQGWWSTNEKDVAREKNLYERMNKKSATTGEPIQSPLFAMPQMRLGSKFSLSKEFNTRRGDELTSLIPGLAAAAEEGYVPNLQNRRMRTDFWKDVVNRRGMDTAKGMAKKLADQQEEEPRRRSIRARLRSIAE